jgi:hypothetical protein
MPTCGRPLSRSRGAGKPEVRLEAWLTYGRRAIASLTCSATRRPAADASPSGFRPWAIRWRSSAGWWRRCCPSSERAPSPASRVDRVAGVASLLDQAPRPRSQGRRLHQLASLDWELTWRGCQLLSRWGPSSERCHCRGLKVADRSRCSFRFGALRKLQEGSS